MKLKILGFLILLSASLILTTGCASTGNGSQMEQKTKNEVRGNQDLSLEDYLRRLSHVKIYGSGYNLRVSIRSKMSLTDFNEQPLFVLNGQDVGNSYADAVRSIAPGSITSVEAIPPSRASMYGMRGIAGVIVIKTE